MKKNIVVLVSLLLLSLSGCVSRVDDLKGNEELTPISFENVIQNEDVRLVDVRTEQEFSEGHIIGAENIPLDEISMNQDNLKSDEHILLYCRSGNRSGQALDILKKRGFKNVSHLVGGVKAWQEQGLDLTYN